MPVYHATVTKRINLDNAKVADAIAVALQEDMTNSLSRWMGDFGDSRSEHGIRTAQLSQEAIQNAMNAVMDRIERGEV